MLRPGVLVYRSPDGLRETLLDPYHGLCLTYERAPRPACWMLVSSFRSIRDGQTCPPYLVEYGRN